MIITPKQRESGRRLSSEAISRIQETVHTMRRQTKSDKAGFVEVGVRIKWAVKEVGTLLVRLIK